MQGLKIAMQKEGCSSSRKWDPTQGDGFFPPCRAINPGGEETIINETATAGLRLHRVSRRDWVERSTEDRGRSQWERWVDVDRLAKTEAVRKLSRQCGERERREEEKTKRLRAVIASGATVWGKVGR